LFTYLLRSIYKYECETGSHILFNIRRWAANAPPVRQSVTMGQEVVYIKWKP